MKRTVFITAMICICSMITVFSQEGERYVEIRGRAELDMQPLNGATATLYEGNKKVNTARTGADGMFSFKLEPNKYYVVEVGKEKYIAKRLAFDTSLPDEEKGVWVREFAISVVRSCDGVDYAPLSNPVDIVKYNAKRKDFESDKDQLTKMRSKLENINIANEQCLADKYKKLIKEADRALANKSFDEAKEKYAAAAEINPNDDYAQKKSSEIDQQMSRQENIDNLYTKTIGEADALVAQNKAEEALQKFKAASILKPQESYPKQKATELESQLAKVQANQQAASAQDAQYNNVVDRANSEMATKNYEGAKQLYQQALQMKPDDAGVQSKIAEIDRAILAQKQQALDKNKSIELDKKYQMALEQGDNLYKNKDYKGALEAYNQALALKPNEMYPKQRVNQLNGTISAEEAKKQREIDAGYQNALVAAEKAATTKDFQSAKGFYQQALQFKPDDAALKSKLAEMDRLMAQESQNKQQQAEKQRQYQALIQKADQLYASKNYDAAKAVYQDAANAKPDERYPLQRIQEIDTQIQAEQAQKLQKNQEGYQAAISSGNTMLAQKQYQNAKDAFQRALSFKPDDVFAKNKMTEIDNLILQEQGQVAALKSKKTEFNGIIARADNFFTVKDYASAKSEYLKASQLLPDEQYPKQRLQEIDKQIAIEDVLKQREINSKYQSAIASANGLMSQKQYESAKKSFQEALSYKPDDIYTKNKLTEVDNLIKQEQTQQAAFQAKKNEFNTIVAGADKLFAAKNYPSARAEYQKALQLLPEEQYPKQKMQEIDRLSTLAEAEKQRELESKFKSALGAGNSYYAQKSYENARNSYQEALSYKPDDADVKNKIAEVDKLIRQEQAQQAALQTKKTQYDGIISGADSYFDAKDYTSAKSEFAKALQMMPTEQYPRQKIMEIDKLLAAEAQKQRETDAKYQSAITAANGYYTQKSYANAKNSYQEALTYKPDDNLAKSRILEIENIMKQEMAQQAAVQAKQNQYNDLIAKADGLFNTRNYPQAKDAYKSAFQVMPNQTYPQQRMDEIDRLIAEQQRVLAANQTKENSYKLTIGKADGLFAGKQYDAAKTEYNNALTIKPDETYPKNRITEIDKIIAQQQQTQAKESGFKNVITEADRLFAEKNYTESKSAYAKALGFMPNEAYPKSQIAKIDNLLAETEKQRQQELAKQKKYDDLIAQADKLFNSNAYPKAKELYQNALTIKPDEQYPKAKIARIDEIYALVAQQQKSNATNNAQKPASTSKKMVPAELKFKNEGELQNYLSDLKKEFPEGVTEEVYKEQYKVTTRFIVIRGSEVKELREIHFLTYGGKQYFMNGKPITQMYFESQVKQREGEYFKKFEY